MKCKRGVGWKPTTKCFNLNAPEEILKMHEELASGRWKNGKPKRIKILYPKKRDGLSISFKDRVYQRSINDNVLYPKIQNSFIYDNWACQKGKGPDACRSRIKKWLRSCFIKYGINCYVLHIDIKKYYQNMRHELVEEKFKRYINEDVFKAVKGVLDWQYKGDIGYDPGSQMVQIAGISFLDDLDHYLKEKCHLKYYIRYMDDIFIVHHDRNVLKILLNDIEDKLHKIGLESHEKKTRIIPLKSGFTFLGFKYRVTNTGKIIMSLNGENVKHERRKLRRLVRLAKAGETTKDKADECFRGWCNHASKGNSYKLLTRMNKFYKDLWRETSDAY